MSRSGYTCVKLLFCNLNVLLWLSGCGIIGVGIWLKISYSEYTTLLPQYQMFNIDTLAIFVGVIIFLVAFFGCCGSWFEMRCMLITYFSLVIFMFLLEFLLSTLAFTFREYLGYTFREELKFGIEMHFINSTENSLFMLWSRIQSTFHCCGVTDYEDWYDIQAWRGKKFVPRSCCMPQFELDPQCGTSGNPDKWFQNGCSDQVQMWFVERLHIFGVIGLAVTFVQLFGLISSMLLFCTVKHKRSSSTYTSYNQSP